MIIPLIKSSRFAHDYSSIDNNCVTYLTHFLAGMNRIEICELEKVFQLMVACTPHINISTSHWNKLLRTFCWFLDDDKIHRHGGIAPQTMCISHSNKQEYLDMLQNHAILSTLWMDVAGPWEIKLYIRME